MLCLQSAGTIIFLDRRAEVIVSCLDTTRRPLLAAGSEELFCLEKERRPLYQLYTDIVVDNNGTPEEAVAAIIERMGENADNSD